MSSRILIAVFIVAVSGLTTAYGQDLTFAVNFAADEPIDGDGSIVDGVAGLLGSANWDNTTTNIGSLTGLTEQNSGVAIPGVSVSWDSNNTWSSQGRGDEVGNVAPAGNDRNLMSGYLDTNNNSLTEVTFDGLPYDGTYDVLVYMKGGVTDVRGGVVTIGDKSVRTLDAGLFDGDYILTFADDFDFNVPESVSEGNVLLFSGISGESFTLNAQAREIDPGNGTWRIPINAIEITGQTIAEDEPFIPQPFPGPVAGAGVFNVREIVDNGAIDSLRTASASIATAAEFTEGVFPILDVTDPETNPAGGPIVQSTPRPFLTNTGGDDDNITSIGKGRIRVGPGQDGDYTFQVNANDGFALRVVGQDIAGTTGGFIDLNDSTTMVRLSPGTSLGVVNLAEGEYDLEFLTFENEGEAFYEVTSARGAFTDPNAAQWIPVGDSTSLPATTRPELISLSAANAFSGPAVTEAEGVAKVRENFQNGLIDDAKEIDIIALHDPESGNNLNGASIPFPGDTDADDNDFATVVFGEFVLDDGDEIPNEPIDLTFAIQSDDNGQLHIVENSFVDTFGNANTAIVDVNGDGACTGDFNSGNINAICTITLTEDTYEFNGYHREQGGGAYFQVWWAEGEQTAFNQSDFNILTVAAEIPANEGLELVGGTDLACDFDGNGECDITDIDRLMTDAANGLHSPEFDLTGDGFVDDADRDAWLGAAGPARGKAGALLVGDSDLDGDVDSVDLNSVGVSWQDATETRWSQGNFVTNEGQGVDSNDLNGVGINWQQAVGDAAAVPEPGSALMFVLGLGVWGLARHGKRRRRCQ